jgi:flagellar basal body-associated protein FliL
MSTILEALKKSEQERRLNDVPTLADMPTPQEASKWPQILLIALIVLISILLLVLAVRWWGADQAAEQGPVHISNQTVGAVPADQSTSTDKILVNVVSYSEIPGQSFTMINGQLYRENEFVRAGLKVEKIEVDRVILNLRGRRIIRTP